MARPASSWTRPTRPPWPERSLRCSATVSGPCGWAAPGPIARLASPGPSSPSGSRSSCTSCSHTARAGGCARSTLLPRAAPPEQAHVRVLYVNHTAAVSGAEHSLLALLAALPAGVDPVVATPPGALQREVQALGIVTTTITGTAGSLRLHPVHTPQALTEMSIAAWQLRRAVRRHRVELVHANSIRAGLVAAGARLKGVPSVVHVRDCLPPGRTTRAIVRVLARSATVVVANSKYTAQALQASDLAARVRVVHNAVDADRFDPERIDRAGARARLKIPAGRLLLGVVAQLTP